MDKTDFIRAKALIDTPEKWCKGAGAQDNEGNAVNLANRHLVAKMCPVGACYWINRPDLCNKLHSIAKKLGYDTVMDLNDASDHETMMSIMDVAIGEAFIVDKCIFKPGDIVEHHNGRWRYWTTIHTKDDAKATVLLDPIFFRVRRFNPEVQVLWLT